MDFHRLLEIGGKSKQVDLSFFTNRERDLDLRFSPAQKDLILVLAHKAITASCYLENGHEIMRETFSISSF